MKVLLTIAGVILALTQLIPISDAAAWGDERRPRAGYYHGYYCRVVGSQGCIAYVKRMQNERR